MSTIRNELEKLLDKFDEDEDQAAYEEAVASLTNLPVELVQSLGDRKEDIDYLCERVDCYSNNDTNLDEGDLLKRIETFVEGAASEAELDECLRIIGQNIPMPIGEFVGLVCYPEDDASELTPEELLAKAKSWRRRPAIEL